jgi:hypothetical protein
MFVCVEFQALLKKDGMIHMISRRMTVLILWNFLEFFDDLRVGDITSAVPWLYQRWKPISVVYGSLVSFRICTVRLLIHLALYPDSCSRILLVSY